jgi:hypothetical protein
MPASVAASFFMMTLTADSIFKTKLGPENIATMAGAWIMNVTAIKTLQQCLGYDSEA